MSKYAVIDPLSNEELAEYPTIGSDELRAVIAAADESYQQWSQTSSVAERASLVRRAGELHVARRDELAEIIVRETGKPISQAREEVEFSASIYEYYADNAELFLADEVIEVLSDKGSALVRRSPFGTVLGIMPWNFPYYQVARFAAPNLIVGNPILLKHASQCPESAAAMHQIFQDAGFPVGAYTNIFASIAQVEEVIADPRVRGVSLTGSERAGARVAELAGRNLKKVVLELGGSDPFVVLGTDDLDQTVAAAVAARIVNAGQACNAAKRFIIIDELYEPFLRKFTAAFTAHRPEDPWRASTSLGPLSSHGAAQELELQVRDAVLSGATLVAGGNRIGSNFEPTVLTNVSHENPAYGQEFFGPVAMVHRVVDEAEAVRVANDTAFGLGSYVFTPDAEQAARVANRLEAGMVFVNTVSGGGVEIPFGGIKRSGFGRELGRAGVDEFVNKKLIRVGA